MDAEIENAQKRLVKGFALAQPVEEMVKRSRLASPPLKERKSQERGRQLAWNPFRASKTRLG